MLVVICLDDIVCDEDDDVMRMERRLDNAKVMVPVSMSMSSSATRI
jgi:hypothetical protein